MFRPTTAVFVLLRVAEPLAAQPATRWHVEAQPALVIGHENDPNYEFLQVFGTMRTSMGDILVGNFGTAELRVFDSTGKFKRSIGRRGEGPGEFQYLVPLARAGDTVFIADLSQNRLSVIEPTAGFMRLRSFATLNRRAEPLARLSNGALLARLINSSTARTQKHGVFRDSVEVVLIPPNDPLRFVAIGTYPGNSILNINPTNKPQADAFGIFPFGANWRFSVIGNSILIGSTNSSQLLMLDESGKVVREIQLDLKRKTLDHAKFVAARNELSATLTDHVSISQITERYALRHRPEYEPMYDRLMTSRDSLLWVEHFRYKHSDSTVFSVFSRTGRKLADVIVPPKLQLFEVGYDYVIGVRKDDGGVETVVMYRYSRR